MNTFKVDLGARRLTPVGGNAIASPRQTITALGSLKLTEPEFLHPLVKLNFEHVLPGVLLLGEQVACHAGYIDLLGLDPNGCLVVVELKRGERDRRVDKQACDYADAIAGWTLSDAIRVRAEAHNSEAIREARVKIVEFLRTSVPHVDTIRLPIRIVLVAANFPEDVRCRVAAQNANGLDIRCLRVTLYEVADEYYMQFEEVTTESDDDGKYATLHPRGFTYDLFIDGQRHARRPLPYKRLVLDIATFLVKAGIGHEELQRILFDLKLPGDRARTTKSRQRGLWRVCDGTLETKSAFVASARTKYRDFNEKQWFCEPDELIHYGGQTLALVKDWGESTEKQLKAWQEGFPQFKIQWTKRPQRRQRRRQVTA